MDLPRVEFYSRWLDRDVSRVEEIMQKMLMNPMDVSYEDALVIRHTLQSLTALNTILAEDIENQKPPKKTLRQKLADWI